uniref:Uncharacterized protein n=1 Tax=Nelumbo nucifera TaxID=4432 RepID=A0A822XN59_NELNU|nr:TPA_asm: hypothetical protein HUJ06_021859 [Nelumbo nucifera]
MNVRHYTTKDDLICSRDEFIREALLDPFNQKKQNILSSAFKTCNCTSSNELQQHVPVTTVHLFWSFRR